ncbi:MAG: M16 family metallopeptidase [Candidatus Kapaibacteriales bacterium]
MSTKLLTLLVYFVVSFSFGFSQIVVNFNSLDQSIPPDPKVRIGVLPNGMKYYIRYNKKPEKRAELILAVNAGAICEDPDQNGLAHFCEHMAFNGTRNFPKQNLINYLESIGMKFGPELNAYTSWDETVYMLQIPTDTIEQFKKGFMVLEDWANYVSFDPDEVDKERGVLIEEWRLGRGADERVERIHSKLLFNNSKYSLHDVIGDTSILRNASYDVLRRFYNDWYRPDLMAIIAIGDFEVDEVESIIKERFSKIPQKQNPRQRPYVEIPYHKEVYVSIAKDKELSFPRVSIYFKDKADPQGTYRSYLAMIKETLFSQMLQYRLNEYLRKENPPFKFLAFGSKVPLGRLNNAFVLFAGAREDGILLCTETLLTEAYRIFQYGFTNSELTRAKNEYLRRMEQTHSERDKIESRNFAMEVVRNFLTNEPIPGIEYELELVEKFLPEIQLEEINELSNKFLKKENVVITISCPDKPDVAIPTEDQVLALFNEISNKKLEKYVDKVPTSPLFTKKVKEGTIISEKTIPELNATEWTLSNGAKVVLKQTDFKNDEILFSAFSWGGLSLIPDSLYFDAIVTDEVMAQSGVGNFTQSQLEKFLADKIVRLSPYLSDYMESLDGSCSSKDLQTLLEMVHLHFTSPRVDKQAFESVKIQLISDIVDSQNQPEKVFNDSASYYLWNKNFRRKPLEKSDIEKVQLSNVFDIFAERFSNPADFIFLFVGNLSLEAVKPLVLKYIASIPSSKNLEKWKNIGLQRITGKFEKHIFKGLESKSFVRLAISGSFNWNFKERFLFRAMMNLAQIRIREFLREDKSGVYGVGVWGRPSPVPNPTYEIGVYFGCDPNRADELTTDAINILKNIAQVKQNESYLVKVKEILRRELEVQIKENNYWVNLIKNYYLYNEPIDAIKQTEKMIDELNLDDILKIAKKYIKFDNYARFVLYPENFKK